MRARIVKSGGFWVGEVYGEWSNFFGLEKRIGWDSVTGPCWTKWGAKLELEKWKRENCPEEFEL